MFDRNTANQVFPFFMEENPRYCDSNVSTQLQLFGNISAACNADQTKLKEIDRNDAFALNAPIKRSAESLDLATQNNLQISFSNLFRDEIDRSRRIPQVNTMPTGLRLSYDNEERHSSVASASGSMPSFLFTSAVHDNLGREIEHQNEEFNRFLRFQEEQLAEGLRETKQRHVASFMNRTDGELSRRLQAKDLEIESMNRKNHYLDDQIRRASTEAQTWQQRTQYSESIVHALRNGLQLTMAQGAADAAAAAANQLREGYGESEVNDAASSFYPNSVQDGKKQMLSVACKGCNRRESCMLLLPCRHMCLCRDCDAMVGACPICLARKTASFEVYMS